MTYYLETEGVFILCSSLGIKNRYKNAEFNYDFPEGILEPINKGEVLAIATDSGDDIKIKININKKVTDVSDNFLKLSDFKLNILHNDKIYLLSHADFTQICDQYKGDIDKYILKVKEIVQRMNGTYDGPNFLDNVTPGWYEVTIYAKCLDDNELEELEESKERYHYSELIINLNKRDDEPKITITDIPAI